MKDGEVFRVLTLDGGGMRGLYSATLLYTLTQRFCELGNKIPDIGKAFNLICGTSTGAILACGLASGISLKTIQELYIDSGKLIFDDPVPSTKMIWWWILKHLRKPAANQRELQNALENQFKKETLDTLYHKRNIALCIPTIDANNFRPWVFKTPHLKGKHRDNKYTLVEVCLASCAAPIFFQLANQKDPNDSNNQQYFVDGGLWINNPILMGIIEALTILEDRNIPIEVISVGTCSKPSGDPKSVQNPKWGIGNWITGNTLMEMTLSAQSFGNNFMAQFLCESLRKKKISIKVIRLEETNKAPEQYSAIGLDKADSTAIQTLTSLAIQDANNIHSKSMLNTSYDPLKEIFTNITYI